MCVIKPVCILVQQVFQIFLLPFLCYIDILQLMVFLKWRKLVTQFLSCFRLPRWHSGKESTMPMQETWEIQVPALGQENPLEKGMATHSSILAWKIPWTKESGGLQFLRSQTVNCMQLSIQSCFREVYIKKTNEGPGQDIWQISITVRPHIYWDLAMCQLCNSFTYINSFKPYNDLQWLVIILQMRKMRHRKVKFFSPKII